MTSTDDAPQSAGNGRQSFWQELDTDYSGEMVYPHELIALRATLQLVEMGFIDRATVFNKHGAGFINAVEAVAQAFLTSLPEFNGRREFQELIEGRPTSSAASVSPTSQITP